MSNTKIQFKRTTVSGRLPNTTNSANSQYIDAGEFAINLTDQKVLSSNGTVSFEVGANLTTSYISSNVSVGGITLINTTAMSTNNIFTYGSLRILNTANTAKYQDISVDVNGYINFGTVSVQTTLGAGTGYWNLISSLGPIVANSQVGGYYFSSANNATSGSQDTGIYRIASGQLTVGNSTLRDTSGSIVLSALYAGNTAANTAANTSTIKISTNATQYSTINSTAINVGSNAAQFGTAMYISANGNLTVNGVANLSNTVYGWSKVDTALAVNTYYKLAELPASTASTQDHIVIEGILDDNWGSSNKTQVQILFSNRNAFTYRYYLNGALQSKSKIVAYLEANSGVSIYYATEVASASYMSASLNITQTINNGVSGATVYATPVANTTLPTGTRNFDTSNSSYTPLLTIPYSGVPSYSGQNIILANTTTFAGTSNNATYLNGQAASYYTNATNISTGTLSTAQLPAAINVATSVYVGNSTVYTTTNATNFSGTSNNALYLGGFTWTAPGAIGSGTANSGAFTTLTTTQGNIANTTSATNGQVIAYASMQGGRTYYAYDLNSYASLYEARFINSSTSTNVPSGMTGNFYWFGMGAGDTSSRGFDLLGTSTSQFWFRERSANTWNQVITSNNAHTLNGVITHTANVSFSGNATSQIVVGSTTINATSYSGTSNNALYLGGTLASGYQTTAGLSANVLTLSANAATYLGNNSGTIANVASWITGNAATAYTNSTAFASNATNISSGTLATARLPAAINVATSVYVGNATVYSVINSTALYASSANIAGNISLSTNNTRLTFVANSIASGNLSFFTLQDDNNFVFYNTATDGSSRAIWSVFSNSNTAPLSINVPIKLTSAIQDSSGANGSSGQVLTSNGTGWSWATPSGSGSVNIAAQYTWSNSHTWTSNIALTSNTTSLMFAGPADNNWKLGRNIATFTKAYYSNNSLDFLIGSSSKEGITFGNIANTSFLELGSDGSWFRANVSIGNVALTSMLTVNGTVAFSNSSAETLTVYANGQVSIPTLYSVGTPSFNSVTTTNNGNGTNYAVGDDAWIGDINTADTISIRGQQSANNGYIVFGNADTTAQLGRSGAGPLTYSGPFSASGNVSVSTINATSYGVTLTSNTSQAVITLGNSSVQATLNGTSYSGTSNNALYLGGTIASGYQTTAGLSANVLTLSSNSTTYLGNNSGTIANVASWITGNAATAYTNSTAFSANATNLANGTVPTARLGSGTANSTTVLYGNGVWAAASSSGTTAGRAYAFSLINGL